MSNCTYNIYYPKDNGNSQGIGYKVPIKQDELFQNKYQTFNKDMTLP
jgi:hypothetical protein